LDGAGICKWHDQFVEVRYEREVSHTRFLLRAARRLELQESDVCGVRAVQVRGEVQAERAGREDATAAVMKMKDIIGIVRDEMVEAQLAADQCASSPHRLAICNANALPVAAYLLCT